MERPWRVGLHARHEARALLSLVPSLHPRSPAAHVLTIHFVLSAKFPAERRFVIQDYEQMHEGNCCDGAIESRFAGPKTIHRPIQPTAKPAPWDCARGARSLQPPSVGAPRSATEPHVPSSQK